MTRIGRCQIKTRHLTGNASYRRDNLAPLKFSRPNCVDHYQRATVARAILPEWPTKIDTYAITITTPDPQAFFENRIVASDPLWEAYFLTKH